jgi:hypothetical protein
VTMEVTTLEHTSEIESINQENRTSEQGAAAVVADEEHPRSPESLHLGCRVTMGVMD